MQGEVEIREKRREERLQSGDDDDDEQAGLCDRSDGGR